MGAIKRVRIELNRQVVLSVAASHAAPHVADTTRKVLNRARVLTPVRTGTLRASLRMVMMVRRTYVQGRVETSIKYATYVHEGTKAHNIQARRKQYLKFLAAPGEVIFRKMVRHPGTRARPFLRQALYDEAVPAGFRVSGQYIASSYGSD